MTERPYVLLSSAMSLDGYLDSATDDRLLLSNDADFDRVDEVRSSCDAILVGAGTVRCDNPSLLVRSAARQEHRRRTGRPASPLKVTVTASGDLDPAARFFTRGDSEKLIYHSSAATHRLTERFTSAATLVEGGPTVRMTAVVADLYQRGVRRLMVEGGGTIHTGFLTEGVADELQLVVAPFFVGDSRACRFVQDGAFRWCSEHPAALAEVRRLGDVVLLRYALSERFTET